MSENIERIFNQDNRNKKMASYGAMKRKATRGTSRKAIKFPSDFLSTKEKKALNGEVKVYNKYSILKNLPNSIADLIKDKSDEEVKNIFNIMKDNNKQKDIAKHFGITTGTLSYYLYKYGCVIRHRRIKLLEEGAERMYKNIEDVPSWEQIKAMPVEKQFIACLEAKESFGTTKLKKHWGKASSTIHSLFSSLGIYEAQKDKRPEVIPVEKNVEPVQTIKTPVTNISDEKLDKILEALNNLNSDENIQYHKNIFSINLNGVFGKEELENKLLSLSGIMESGKKYKFNLMISEEN